MVLHFELILLPWSRRAVVVEVIFRSARDLKIGVRRSGQRPLGYMHNSRSWMTVFEPSYPMKIKSLSSYITAKVSDVFPGRDVNWYGAGCMPQA
jgi:hypothetical protein